MQNIWKTQNSEACNDVLPIGKRSKGLPELQMIWLEVVYQMDTNNDQKWKHKKNNQRQYLVW